MILLQLIPLTTDYLPDVLDLDRRCFGGLWNESGYQRELESDCSELLALIPTAVPTHTPALLGFGCAWHILEEAHITLLAAHPDYPRQGLGQAILVSLLQQAHDRGLERATLEVRASNQAALGLYEKFGFQVAGRRKRYYPDTGEDALILWLGQLQHPQFVDRLGHWSQIVGDRLSQHGWQLGLAGRSLPAVN